jgi:pSer/pThr/pTyr-binding forkhead associated (FHA) protein
MCVGLNAPMRTERAVFSPPFAAVLVLGEEALEDDEEESENNAILRWIAEVQQLSVDQFAAWHKGLFFVTEAPENVSAVAFRTRTEPTSAPPVRPRGVKVIPLAKSRSSPYRDRISIGRARNCDIVIRHSTVSKLHAHLRPREDGGHTIVDLGSHNGTRLNGQVLAPNAPVPLCAGDVVVFGVVAVHVLEATTLHEMLSQEALQHGGSVDLTPLSSRGIWPAR